MDDKVKLPTGDNLPVVLVANKTDLLGNVHSLNEREIDEFAKVCLIKIFYYLYLFI